MTDEDLSIAIGMARERLRRHGRYMLAPSTVALGSDPVLPIQLDGEPVILHYSMDDPENVTTYAVDKTLTLGQFIDGFNTTMAVMYGPMKPALSLGIKASGAHTHQISPYSPGPMGVAYPQGPHGPAVAVPLGQQLTWHESEQITFHDTYSTNKT